MINKDGSQTGWRQMDVPELTDPPDPWVATSVWGQTWVGFEG